MPVSEKLIAAGFIVGLCLIALALFAGMPALAGRLGWNSGPMRRSDFYRQLLGWGIVSLVGLGIFIRSGGVWQGALVGLLVILVALWKVSRSGGRRLRDMGWPRWTVWFMGLPLFCLLILFWPPNPRRSEAHATPA